MIRNEMRAAFGLLAAVAIWAIPATASAHAGNDDPNVVHACVGNVSKVVRIVGVSGSCLTLPPLVAETAVHWDIKGKDGANGKDGLNGKDGTNGIDGTSATFVGYFSGNANGCPNGGAIFAAGNPPVNAYVCNGTNGIDGKDGAGAPRADGPCFDNTNRYVDCGNGTVTDTVTGLIWLKQADCLPSAFWAAANQGAAALANGQCGLTDGSSAGDWRLPTNDEWSATIARAVTLGCKSAGPGTAPSLTNDAGTACLSVAPSSFAGVASALYWSSTANEVLPAAAWNAFLGSGLLSNGAAKSNTFRVWPVRSGR